VMPDLSAALMSAVRSASDTASSSTPIMSAPAVRAARCTAVLQFSTHRTCMAIQHKTHVHNSSASVTGTKVAGKHILQLPAHLQRIGELLRTTECVVSCQLLLQHC
jgi:hypothetical protein